MNTKVMVRLDETATTVARFRANSDRANLNCNEDPANSKSKKDEIARLGMTQYILGLIKMKTYNNLHENLYSITNLELAFRKARKGKSSKYYVIQFENNLEIELKHLSYELENLTYQPRKLKRFIIRDPKTRTIHSSEFRDRVVYHALVNIIEPIFEKIFIYDSYASRLNKGTLNGVLRFEQFKRKVSKNGRLVKNAVDNNQIIGYCLKADIKHYFETVDHEILVNILKKKIKDDKIIWLVNQILSNYDAEIKGKGMPLGNLTSQFLANVYLNELDYFVKHELKTKYYVRYVDDFIILHNNKDALEYYKNEINKFLINNLKLELHPDKSKIIPLRNGINFLGYRLFNNYKLLRKTNLRKFENKFNDNIKEYKEGYLSHDDFISSLSGWCGYAQWANTYNLRKRLLEKL